MNSYPKLAVEDNVDPQAGYFARFVYGGEEVFPLHCHDFYEVFIVVKGVVPHEVNGVIQKLPEGSMVFVRPDDVHRHLSNDPETVFINLTFTRETTEKLFSYLFEQEEAQKLLSCDVSPMVILDKTSKKELISQIDELNTANWKDKKAQKLRMRTILTNLFPYFMQSLPQEDEETVPRWLTELAERMSKPENFIAGAKQMQILSNRSREHLARSFKKYFGVSVTDYINDLRVNYASNLLINTNIPVIDICFTCGFQSVSYFYRVFKKKNAVTPYVFRDQYKIS